MQSEPSTVPRSGESGSVTSLLPGHHRMMRRPGFRDSQAVALLRYSSRTGTSEGQDEFCFQEFSTASRKYFLLDPDGTVRYINARSYGSSASQPRSHGTPARRVCSSRRPPSCAGTSQQPCAANTGRRSSAASCRRQPDACRPSRSGSCSKDRSRCQRSLFKTWK